MGHTLPMFPPAQTYFTSTPGGKGTGTGWAPAASQPASIGELMPPADLDSEHGVQYYPHLFDIQSVLLRHTAFHKKDTELGKPMIQCNTIQYH